VVTPPTTSSVAVLGVQVLNAAVLPSTGASTAPLIVVGVTFLLAGLVLTVVGRTRNRHPIS
jgi:LPXTG-motif cell wall-anchored protein